MSFFDKTDTGELNTRMFDDVKKVQDGIAEKVGVALNEKFTDFLLLLV
jgi:hypothetical protein